LYAKTSPFWAAGSAAKPTELVELGASLSKSAGLGGDRCFYPASARIDQAALSGTVAAIASTSGWSPSPYFFQRWTAVL
jgi:hypothetical protein